MCFILAQYEPFLKKKSFYHVLRGQNSALNGFSLTRYCRIRTYVALLKAKTETEALRKFRRILYDMTEEAIKYNRRLLNTI